MWCVGRGCIRFAQPGPEGRGKGVSIRVLGAHTGRVPSTSQHSSADRLASCFPPTLQFSESFYISAVNSELI